MNYRNDWNLASIPPEVIPDALLKEWRAKKNAAKSKASMTAEERSSAASHAVNARWAKKKKAQTSPELMKALNTLLK